MAKSKIKPLQVTFKVVRAGNVPNEGKLEAFLIHDNWNDWGDYRTQYHLHLFDENGIYHELQEVKIGHVDLKPAPTKDDKPGYRSPHIPQTFERLEKKYFSLGQDRSYYQKLAELSPELREAITSGLRDLVANPELLKQVLREPVIEHSLMRSVTLSSVKAQFTRILRGDAVLEAFRFSYQFAEHKDTSSSPAKLQFRVVPESLPPTNIHVLIGSNGTGKTYTLNQMVRSLNAKTQNERKKYGAFIDAGTQQYAALFANVVLVSFSAFDSFDTFQNEIHQRDGFRSSYIGLKKFSRSGEATNETKSPQDLTSEFYTTLKVCIDGSRRLRWRKAISFLTSDPIFAVTDLIEKLAALEPDSPDLLESTRGYFEALSSGHKIVLLTIARLVETVEEKSLILLDEPEAHLHPPLLSAFIRSISELLINRNGVAIIATHSPVVLQEVPKNCVWKLRRSDSAPIPERPEIETFGENVAILTREVFRLEVVKSGFHRLLSEVADDSDSYEEALAIFDKKLGSEARAILRGFVLNQDKERDAEQ
jgi:predicted ATPase